MMEESRTQRLHELLRRLGKALHQTVVRSDEVRACLEELREDGWRAVMMLETSLVCGEDGSLDVGRGTMRLHVDTETVSFRRSVSPRGATGRRHGPCHVLKRSPTASPEIDSGHPMDSRTNLVGRKSAEIVDLLAEVEPRNVRG